MAFVDDRERDFGQNTKSSVSKFMCEARLIRALKQTWSKRGVNLHCRINDGSGDLIYMKGMGARNSSHA